VTRRVKPSRHRPDRLASPLGWIRCATMPCTRLRRPGHAEQQPPAIPADLARPAPTGTGHTQQALGRVLLDLTRRAPEAARRIVSVSPEVSSSTNLGGWLNKVGVWSPVARTNWFADDAETILHWRERPTGQHVELGIAETNLPGELGGTWSRWGQRSCRSAWSTTPSSTGRWNPGRSVSAPVASRSWSARPPVPRSPRRAVRASRSPRLAGHRTARLCHL
jgi:hypothetical protein